jgi:hypothetical protein
MRRILERCQQIFPENNGERITAVQFFKAWRKRKEIEDEMLRLKEHIQNCYARFHVCSSSLVLPRPIFTTPI